MERQWKLNTVVVYQDQILIFFPLIQKERSETAMGCPHLLSCRKITSGSPVLSHENAALSWTCIVCNASKSSWLCLYCGKVHCGRYVNGHAMTHWEQHSDHCLCLDFESLTVYCYECDEYVAEDAEDKNIQSIRDRVVIMQASIALGDCGRSDSTLDPALVNNRLQNEDAETPEKRTLKSARVGSARRGSRKRLSNEDVEIENKDSKKLRTDKKQNKTSQESRKVAGLRNLGNTCFMNAVLQSLSKITEFSWYFKQLPSLESKVHGSRTYSTRAANEKALIAEELRKVLISLNYHEGKGAISPESLFRVIWEVVPRFRGYQQQDAHEFLRYMLDRLHTELMLLLPSLPSSVVLGGSLSTEMSKGKSSIVTAVFGGTLQSEVCCLRCRSQSIKHDPFLDLSLDIPESRVIKKDNSGKGSCSLADCLTSFVEVEELAETELYYCESCRSKQKSTKKFWIGRLPNVLCLHIKRFRWEHYLRTKLDSNIEFPLTALDMSRYVLKKSPDDTENDSEEADMNLFDLAAVIVHHGSGAGSGHYTAFAIHEGQWFHFDDSTVKPTNEEVVAKCNAYILFYIRREFRMPQVP